MRKPAYIYRNNAHNCAPVVSWGEGLSQEDLMNKDECIVVSESDQILGHDSKYNAHRFNQDNPNGILLHVWIVCFNLVFIYVYSRSISLISLV
jgi:hypothetical protein